MESESSLPELPNGRCKSSGSDLAGTLKIEDMGGQGMPFCLAVPLLLAAGRFIPGRNTLPNFDILPPDIALQVQESIKLSCLREQLSNSHPGGSRVALSPQRL